ncbi:MAG: alpha/beta hydrolase [Acidimicrobiales bacterium]|jgi:non-heme chloroperoxidase|nr:alpha/beta hydrolase [Acidimicrobiales bacterium]
MRIKSLVKFLFFLPLLTAIGVLIWERLTLRKIDATQKPADWGPARWPKGHSSTVTTDDGAELVVEISGNPDGPIFVLVHGLSADHHSLGPIADRLISQEYCVVGVNQRGHGGSTVGSGGFGPERQGVDLGEVLHALNLEDVHLIGHSMGGVASMSLLTMGPASASRRVTSMTLLSTLADTSGPLRKLSLQLMERGWYQNLFDHPIHGPAFARMFLFGQTPSRLMLDDAMELMQRCPTPHRVDASLGFIGYDIWGLLPLIDCPTTVICGTDDLLTTHSENKRISDSIPTAQMVSIAGAGHMFIWEQPDKIVDAIITAIHPLMT